MGNRIMCVGLDVHKDEVVVAVAEGGIRGEARMHRAGELTRCWFRMPGTSRCATGYVVDPMTSSSQFGESSSRRLGLTAMRPCRKLPIDGANGDRYERLYFGASA